MKSYNPELGDRKVKIGDSEYIAIPDFSALMRVESHGRGLTEILQSLQEQKPRMSDVVIILHSCCMSGGCTLSLESFGNAMWKAGYSLYLEDATALILSLWKAGTVGGDGKKNEMTPNPLNQQSESTGEGSTEKPSSI